MTPGSPAAGPSYHLIKKIPVGGDGGWDYLTLDSAARRLYVTRSTRVMVFDADSGATVGEIANTAGVHGVALAPQINRGFTSNGRSSTVTVFDLKTLKTLSEVKASGENPDAILYDPASRRVFAFNGRGRNATAIDTATGTVAGTIPLDGKPEFAASDGNGRVFVNIEDKSSVAVIDARKLAVEKNFPDTRPAPSEAGHGAGFLRAAGLWKIGTTRLACRSLTPIADAEGDSTASSLDYLDPTPRPPIAIIRAQYSDVSDKSTGPAAAGRFPGGRVRAHRVALLAGRQGKLPP